MQASQIANSLAQTIAKRSRPTPRIPDLPNTDDQLENETTSLGYAEGQSFMIEYVDSKGAPSARRITVWQIIAGSNGAPCLFAQCHERNAMRQFRIDRIQCCIDYDGEVFEDVPKFMSDTFGMSFKIALKAAGITERWSKILYAIRPDATLLAAVARADGNYASVEASAAMQYLEEQAETSGVMLDAGDLAALKRYAKRLHPLEDQILRAIEQLRGRPPHRINRLLRAAHTLIKSDGIIDQREINMLDDLAIELVGTPISQGL